MNYIQFLVQNSLGDLKRNKVRTFLTSLGILIGVLSVVLLIAFGLGLRNYIKNQFDSIGTNLLYVLPARVLGEEGGFQDPGAVTYRFDEKDVTRVERLSGAALVVPTIERASIIQAEGESKSSTVLASSEDIDDILNLEAEFGVFYTRSDLTKKAKKAVLGTDLAKALFKSPERAVGKTVRISNQAFKVVGVLKKKGGGAFGGPNFDTITFVPYTSSSTLNPEKKFINLYVQADSEDVVPELKRDIEKLMIKRYEEDEFQVIEQTELLNVITSIFSIINTVLIGIGSISLVVGGVGIMNIMYASVTERTKEVGIRRAIGATKRDILLQFLTEAVLLSLFGGLLGLIIAYAIVFAIQSLFPAEINAFAVAIALGVSSLIGIFFGVFPARRAANLSPIEAIRYE